MQSWLMLDLKHMAWRWGSSPSTDVQTTSSQGNRDCGSSFLSAHWCPQRGSRNRSCSYHKLACHPQQLRTSCWKHMFLIFWDPPKPAATTAKEELIRSDDSHIQENRHSKGAVTQWRAHAWHAEGLRKIRASSTVKKAASDSSVDQLSRQWGPAL